MSYLISLTNTYLYIYTFKCYISKIKTLNKCYAVSTLSCPRWDKSLRNTKHSYPKNRFDVIGLSSTIAGQTINNSYVNNND